VSFITTGMLWGLGLISVPIVIHLLNKRQVRVVHWAPMEYLRLSIKSSRRKVRLEQLILLAVRCLFVAGLILALARPRVAGDGALGWFAGGGRTSRVIVLDDSLSMGYRVGEATSFELAKGVVARLVEAMDRGDALTLMLASEPERPVVKDAELKALQPFGPLLADLQRSDAAGHWPRILVEAARQLEKAPHPVRELILVTDLRREGWSEEVRAEAERLAEAGLKLKLVDVGSPERANVALVKLEAEATAVVQDVPARLRATIVNGGPAPAGPFSAGLRVGDVERQIQVPRLAPGETLVLPLTQVFPEPGVQAVELRLPDDPLSADNTRACVVDVRPGLEILLVDGDPSSEPYESETDFLAAAYLTDGRLFKPYSVTDSEWLASPPEAFDLTILANLSSLTRDHARALEQLVREGMGLMVFPGDQVDAGLYELLLHRDGEGLLPAAVDLVQDAPVTGMSIEPLEDSPLRSLAALAPGALSGVRARRTLDVGISEAAAESTRVLARWDDAGDDGTGRPAVLEHPFGRGKVLLWTTTADREWGDWPTDPTFLLAVCEAARAVADRGADGLNHGVGAPVVLDTGGAPAGNPELTNDDGQRVGRLVVRESEGTPSVGFEGVTRAGIYHAKWLDPAGQVIERSLAVGAAPAESRLERISPEEVAGWTASLTPQIVHYTDLEQLLQDPGRELWRSLAWAALLLLGLESLLMVWVGRRG
jgi:Aerotolerance regulator N-terminal